MSNKRARVATNRGMCTEEVDRVSVKELQDSLTALRASRCALYRVQYCNTGMLCKSVARTIPSHS